MRARGGSEERKTVTVLCATLPRLQPHADTLAPADALRRVTALLARLLAAVHEAAGYVPRYTGGDLLAFFGAPIPLATHAESALRAALQMQHVTREEMRALWADLAASSPLQIGIHTGEVIVSRIRPYDLHVEYRATSSALRLAARLGSLATPGTSVVSHSTYTLASRDFRWTRLGAVQGDGARDVLPCYTFAGTHAGADAPAATPRT